MLSFSDLVIGSTLLLNAFAILNFNISPSSTQDVNGTTDDQATKTSEEGGGIKATLKQFVMDLRALRIFIALWNFLVMLLMIVFFSN